jgi:esterase
MKLFWRHYGEGPPLVILHGLFGLSDNWVSFGRLFGERYSVYIPDLRNHGQSPHSTIFDFPALEQDLDELAEETGPDPILLMGHSLGGKVAMFYALHQPGRVRKLVVVDISLRRSPPNREHQQLLNAMMAVDFTTARSRSDVDRQLEPLVPDGKLRQFLLKSVYWRDRHTLDWRLNLRTINENLLSIFEGVDTAGWYGGPTLFVRGGESGYVRDEDIPGLLEKFPAGEIKTIAGASHWVHADAPALFYATVSGFLDR